MDLSRPAEPVAHDGMPEQIVDLINEVSALLQYDLERAFRESTLTTTRAHLLWVLHSQGPSTHIALATALQVTARNITGLVDALEADGYVRRSPHPTDRRAVIVTLSEVGIHTVESMAADRVRFGEQLVADMSAKQIANTHRTLEALAARLRTLTAGDPVTYGTTEP